MEKQELQKTNQQLVNKGENALASFGTSQRTMIELADNYCSVFNVVDTEQQAELKKLALNYANKLMTTKSKTGASAFETCTKESIQHTLFECLDKGIDLGKNQGALICYGNQLQLQIEYFGNIAQAKKLVPYLVDIRGMIIYKNDKIDIVVENGSYKVKSHITNFVNMKDSDIIGAYATAIYSFDGGKTEVMGECEVMSLDEIKTSWLQGRNGTSVHNKFGHEMTRKTVESRCAKHLINKASGILEVGEDSDDLTTLEQLGTTIEPKKVVVDIPKQEEHIETPLPQEEVKQETSGEYDFLTPNTIPDDFDPDKLVENWRNTQQEDSFSIQENEEEYDNPFANNVVVEQEQTNNNEWFEVRYSEWLNDYKPSGLYENGKYNAQTKTISIRKIA